MNKHTEGPWQVGDLVENDYSPRYVQVLGADGVKHIARAEYGKTDEECAYNAHLIAAAPELLDALQKCQNAIQEAPRHKGEKWDDDLRRAYMIAGAAINKASGL